MRIDIVTLFPEIVDSVLAAGVIGRAVKKRLLQVECINPRDFSSSPARSVDDRPYGGGPGMVMCYEPIKHALQAARDRSPAGIRAKVVYLSPQGTLLNQAGVESLAENRHLVLLCGRYEGIDERIIASLVDEEWSIGDYVLSGGELPALVLLEAVGRRIPGVLGHQDSASQDSFENGLLDYPHYTRPELIDGMEIPQVLRSGNHEQIQRWRLKQAIGRTYERRPELLEQRELSESEKQLLSEYISEKSKN